jgi:hypothetical protein
MAGILKNEGVICSLLSGENIRVSRSTTDDIAIDNKRLTIIGGINMHDFIDIYLPDEDENKFVTTGLIPRTAIGIAQNLAGTRKHHPCPDDSPYFEIYESTMLSLLNNSKDYFFNSKNDRKKLFIDKDGKDFIRQLKINLEKAMAPGGIYERHKEHAVRIPEMTIRLGGNLHCYEGFEGDISEKTLMTAYKVCMYYSDCYMYFFNLPPQAEMDAYCLDKWFDEHYRDLGIHHELKNDARSS